MSKDLEIELTPNEIDKAVKEWVDWDFPVRSVQLDRGHWESIAPVIAREAQRKLWRLIDDKFHASEDGQWLLIDFDKWQETKKQLGVE